MRKTFKRLILFGGLAVFLAAAAIFVRPAILLNESNFAGLIALLDWPITYSNLNFEISSSGVFDKNVKFSAQNFCVKNENLNMCLPEISADLVLAIRYGGMKITKIREFVISDATFSLKAGGGEKASGEPSNGGGENIKGSLALRFLELFTELGSEDVEKVAVKNFSYNVGAGGFLISGTAGLEKKEQSLVLKAKNSFKGRNVEVEGMFGENDSIKVSLEDGAFISFDVHANAFLEVMEYLRSSDIYRYQTKNIQARLRANRVEDILKFADFGVKAAGPVGCNVAFRLNYPNIDDAELELKFSGGPMDGALITYYFYQKIPKIRGVSSVPNFLLPLVKKLGYDVAKDGVTITRDYTKLPRKVY